jgi:hypothetical protein
MAYAVGFSAPQSPGSPSPQPGIAAQLKVRSVDAQSPSFTLATSASMQRVAWDPAGRFVAGIGAFAPASNRGELEVASTSGARLATVSGASALRFDFGGDGAYLAALADWDDGLQRGELVMLPTSGGAAWSPQVIDQDVTFFLRPVGASVIYGVRGGGRDGLWLGVSP